MTCGARPGTGAPAASPPEATRRADAGTDRVPAVSQFLEDSYVFGLVTDGAQEVGYLLKEKWATCACSPMRSAGSPQASRRSTPTWSRGWSAANGKPARSTT